MPSSFSSQGSVPNVDSGYISDRIKTSPPLLTHPEIHPDHSAENEAFCEELIPPVTVLAAITRGQNQIINYAANRTGAHSGLRRFVDAFARLCDIYGRKKPGNTCTAVALEMQSDRIVVHVAANTNGHLYGILAFATELVAKLQQLADPNCSSRDAIEEDILELFKQCHFGNGNTI